MPTSPIRISHEPGAGLIAEGPNDELAAALLRRAGFLPVSTPGSSWWRSPYDLEPAEESEIASAAYDILSAARYEVTIAPGLRSQPTAMAREFQRIAAEIIDADDLDTVTTLLSSVTDPEHGALAGIARLVEDVRHWTTTDSACTSPDELVLQLDQVIQSVETAQVGLETAVRALESVPPELRGRRSSVDTQAASADLRQTAARSRSSHGPAGPSTPPPSDPARPGPPPARRRP